MIAPAGASDARSGGIAAQLAKAVGLCVVALKAKAVRASRVRLAAGHRAGARVNKAQQKAEEEAWLKARAAANGEVDTAEHAIKRYCPMKLGKRVVPPELDLLGQIKGADPGLPGRLGLTEEKMAFRFTTIRDLLMEQLGCSEMAAGVCVALAAVGKDLQHKGVPQIPAPKRVMNALAWLDNKTVANKQDGSLRAVVEKYPFLLSKTLEQFQENYDLCPDAISYETAMVFRPDRVDKTFSCGGTYKGRCGSCWFS